MPKDQGAKPWQPQPYMSIARHYGLILIPITVYPASGLPLFRILWDPRAL